jgi:hypothetical protein
VNLGAIYRSIIQMAFVIVSKSRYLLLRNIQDIDRLNKRYMLHRNETLLFHKHLAFNQAK